MEPLVDRFGRVHTSLRISVTDRCNIRCFYCMPDEQIRFRPRAEILTFEEILRFVRLLAKVGVRKLRLTGGEPLLRSGLDQLIRSLADLPEIEDLALTTNGILLAEQAETLAQAGLQRINISLDTLKEETFQRIARRPGLDRVLAGIEQALTVGFEQVRLNAIAMKALTEDEILPLVRFARERHLELRFIEFMPLDADENWQADAVLSGKAIRDQIETQWGTLKPCQDRDASQPSVDYQIPGGGTVGFINSVTEPFCHTCNRLRITAEGDVRNCLFSTEEWNVRDLMRQGAADDEVLQAVRDCIAAKKRGHGKDDLAFVRPERAMYQIGG